MVLKVSTEQIITLNDFTPSTINSDKHFMDNDTIFRFYGPRILCIRGRFKGTRYYFILFLADFMDQNTICGR